MDRLLRLLAVMTMSTILAASCGILDPDVGDPVQPLVMTKVTEGSGASSFSFSKVLYVAVPSDVPGCSGVIASTDGRNVYDYIWLSFYFYNDTAVGQELKLERLTFGMPLSSNSADYAWTFTGKMLLKEKSGRKAIIRMQDVRFKTAQGEFILNGDLVARVK